MELTTKDINFKQSYDGIANNLSSHKPNYGYIRVTNKPKRKKPATPLLIGGINMAMLSL